MLHPKRNYSLQEILGKKSKTQKVAWEATRIERSSAEDLQLVEGHLNFVTYRDQR